MSAGFHEIRLDRPVHASTDFTGVTCLEQQAKIAFLIDVPDTIRATFLDLEHLIEIEHRSFSSVQEYLHHDHVEESACIIMDLKTHDREDLSSQLRLAQKACPPVIFICGHSDISAAVRAAKSGAIEVLALPLDPADLLRAVQAALDADKKQRQRRAEHNELRKRYLRLTPREREVLALIASGLLNKQAAAVLGISDVTLQIHRSHVMRKMRAESLPHLVRMAVKLHIPFWRERQSDALGLRPTLIHK